MKRISFALWVLTLGGPLAIAEDFGDRRNLPTVDTRTHFPMRSFPSLAAWEAHKAKLQRQILASAGLWPLPPKTPLVVQRSGRVDAGSYLWEKVVFEPLPGFFVAGNLYLPKPGRGRAPAMLIAHGHWKHGRIHDASDYSVPALAANLAQQGYVALTYDMIGYNDTRQLKHDLGDSAAEQSWSFGSLGLHLWNSMRAVDLLASLPEVDPRRIGMTGASGGGTQTFLLAAVEPRIQVAIPVNMVSATFQGDDACEMAPGLRIGTNNVEIAAMMAPRPMLLVSATGDWTKLSPTEEFPAIRAIYELYGQADRLWHRLIDAGHNYNQQSRAAVYEYLARLWRRPFRRNVPAAETAGLPPKLEAMLVGPKKPENGLAGHAQIFADWQRMAQEQAAARPVSEQREVFTQILGVAWPRQVRSYPAGEYRLLEGRGEGDRVPTRGQAGGTVLVDPDGERKGPLTAGVLRVDVFQTGAAATGRGPLRGDHLTFHRADDAERVQDILTALYFVHAERPPELRLECGKRATFWCLAAAALAPVPVAFTPAEPVGTLTEAEVAKRLLIPGFERAGGVAALQKLLRSK
jgi:dienelactone hydrolase